mgnify:CR=1 FL=1
MFYALASIPLIDVLREGHPKALQTWYADDSAANGELHQLRAWMEEGLAVKGPPRGYFPEPTKSKLLVRPEDTEVAEKVFAGTGVEVVTDCRFLGGFLGTEEGVRERVDEKVRGWVHKVQRLAEVARVDPQAAYTVYSKATQHEWTYVQRVVPDCAQAFAPLELALREQLIPAFFGWPEGEGFGPKGTPLSTEHSQQWRDLFALPLRLGGLGIADPTTTAAASFEASKQSVKLLVEAMREGTGRLELEKHEENVQKAREAAKEMRRKLAGEEWVRLRGELVEVSEGTVRSLDRVIQYHLSCVLHTSPNAHSRFVLNRDEFRDHLAYRYNLGGVGLAARCPCGESLTMQHSQCCKKAALEDCSSKLKACFQ